MEPAAWWRSRRVLPGSVRILAVTLIYLVAARLGLCLALVHPSATAIWPPTGLSIAAALLLGARIWPGIWLGAFIADLLTTGSVGTSLGVASGNTAETLVAVWLVLRYAGGLRAFTQTGQIFRYLVIAGVATMISAGAGVASLLLGGSLPLQSAVAVWTTWWIGDLVSALTLTPLVILWAVTPFGPWPRRRLVELAAMSIVTILVGLVVFTGIAEPLLAEYPRGFMCIPPLLWAAVRFGPREAISASVALSGIAIWGTLLGHGPTIVASLNDSLLLSLAFAGPSRSPIS
jgi:integral membrane sensor domain MASE1